MHTPKFDIHSMVGGGCTNSVLRAVGKLDGVSHVRVTLRQRTPFVQGDAARVILVQIESAIKWLGGYTVKVRSLGLGVEAAS